MRITADQLKAIERAIGFKAEASLVSDHGIHGEPGLMSLEVRANVHGEDVHFREPINGLWRVPFKEIARHTVERLQGYITTKQFSQVKW